MLPLRGSIGKGLGPLGSSLIGEAVTQYVTGGYAANLIGRKPRPQVRAYTHFRHSLRASINVDQADPDEVTIGGQRMQAHSSVNVVRSHLCDTGRGQKLHREFGSDAQLFMDDAGS